MAQPFRDMKAKRAKQPSRDIRAAGEVRLGSVRMGLGINRQREARPHPCQTQTKRSGGLVNQARKMRRSLRKTFPKKVIDGLLKLPYTDKCRWQAFPPSQKPFDSSLSFADPAAGLFSSGPAVSAGRRGFHTPPSPPSSATFSSSSFPREFTSRLSSRNAQLCAFRRYAVALWYYGGNYERRAQWRRCPNRTRITLRPS